MGLIAVDITNLQVAGVIAGVSTIWHIAMYAGVIINRLKRVEDRIDLHEDHIRELRDR